MADLDLVVRGGTVVNATGERRADVGVVEGKVVVLEDTIAASAREEIDADGLHVFPGVIDAHVHFNEPGRTRWEGFNTGSRALAAGGGTLFFDMPLNAHPPTIDAASFDAKLAAAQANSLVDFALWGGLVPDNLDKLEEMAERGVIGFKAFMCSSGIEDFPHVDDRTLREGMKQAARLKLPVAVHAESEAMTHELAQERLARGQTSVRDYLDSRPIEAELDAIRVALELAGETGCALHVVHVSCGEGVTLIAKARAKGVDVSCETCPHYLTFTDEDLLELEAVAKCAPPLRPEASLNQLWERLLGGQIDFVASDHSPSPPEMKALTPPLSHPMGERRGHEPQPSFFEVWGGIAGVQHTLSLLLDQGHLQRGLPLPTIARLLSTHVAARFRLPPEKGDIRIGGDADLALVDMHSIFKIDPQRLLQRHPLTPYAGLRLQGEVVGTLLRGKTVWRDGRIVSQPMGRLVKPVRK